MKYIDDDLDDLDVNRIHWWDPTVIIPDDLKKDQLKMQYNVRNVNDSHYYKTIFTEKYNINILKRSGCSVKIDKNKHEIMQEISDFLKGELVFYIECNYLTAHAFIEVNDIQYYIEMDSYFDIGNSSTTDQRIVIYTKPDHSKKVYDFVKDTYGHKHAIASWYFKSSNGIDSKEFSVAKVKQIYPEFYPYISEDIDIYTKSFLNSSSNILILLGPPGTGKSSFIKNMITTHKCNTMITYDNSLIMSDAFYQTFIMEDANLLVIEDADSFLVSNETQDTVLNKFLSLSDGIIDVSNKKIIFTANISKENISPALVRPGRCYDIIEFRDLSKVEAKKVSDILKIDLIENKDTYTLAEIINQKSNTVKKSKFGFM